MYTMNHNTTKISVSKVKIISTEGERKRHRERESLPNNLTDVHEKQYIVKWFQCLYSYNYAGD